MGSTGHTSSQALGNSTLKRPVSVALGAPLSPRPEDSSKPVDTSSQASLQVVTPDDTEPINHTLEEIYTPTTPPAETLEPGAGILPKNMVQLQKEVNKALECLLMTRSSLVGGNKFQTLKWPSIKMSQRPLKLLGRQRPFVALPSEKPRPTTLLWEAEAQHDTLVREAEANCPSIITETEVCCTTVIRKTSPAVPNMPTPSNNCMQRACNVWRRKP